VKTGASASVTVPVMMKKFFITFIWWCQRIKREELSV
jgi:hypothetical protein